MTAEKPCASTIAGRGVAASPAGRYNQPCSFTSSPSKSTSSRRTPFPQALERVFAAFPILKERRSGTSGMLSGGQQQMLILSSVTIREPAFMLLDEPSLGLAPIIVQQIFDFITAYSRERQTTVVLAEQMAAMALQVAHQGFVLRHGRVIMGGSSQELADADIVAQLSAAYL